MMAAAVVVVVPDYAAFCTRCDWSSYAIQGVDNPENECPACGGVVIGLWMGGIPLAGKGPPPGHGAPPIANQLAAEARQSGDTVRN